MLYTLLADDFKLEALSSSVSKLFTRSSTPPPLSPIVRETFRDRPGLGFRWRRFKLN